MIITNENKDAFVFKTRIEFDSEEGVEFVELREFNTMEMSQMMNAGKLKDGELSDVPAALEQAEKLFAQCVVDSSFVKEDSTKLSGRELYDVLKRSTSLFQEILNTWLSGTRKNEKRIKSTEGGNPLA